jgi:hypothetical protein
MLAIMTRALLVIDVQESALAGRFAAIATIAGITGQAGAPGRSAS